MTTFYSKRNHVALVNGNIVKTYVNDCDYLREVAIYKELKQAGFSQVPKIIEFNTINKTLVLEFIKGPTVLEYLENLEVEYDKAAGENVKANLDKAVSVLKDTLKWLDTFYKVFHKKNKVMGDVNLRNFILKQGKIIGIDFEMCDEGQRIAEKAELLARYLLYDPMESEFKVKVIEEILNHLPVENDYRTLIDHKVIEIEKRRAKSKG